MSLIQAYRRNKTYTHSFPDVTLVFEPNAAGDVVCDVEDASAVERLLKTPTGFRPYDVQAADDAPVSPLLTTPSVEELPPTESPYVLKNGDAVLDLRPMSDAELQAFAKLNGVTVLPRAKGDSIRDKIVATLKAED